VDLQLLADVELGRLRHELANRAAHVAGPLSGLLSNALSIAKIVAKQELTAREASHYRNNSQTTRNTENSFGKRWRWHGLGWLLHSDPARRKNKGNRSTDGSLSDGLERDSSGKPKSQSRIGIYGEIVKPFLSSIFSIHVEDPRIKYTFNNCRNESI